MNKEWSPPFIIIKCFAKSSTISKFLLHLKFSGQKTNLPCIWTETLKSIKGWQTMVTLQRYLEQYNFVSIHMCQKGCSKVYNLSRSFAKSSFFQLLTLNPLHYFNILFIETPNQTYILLLIGHYRVAFLASWCEKFMMGLTMFFINCIFINR